MIFIAGDWTRTDVSKFDLAEQQLIETEKYHSIYGTAEVINPIKILEQVPFFDFKQQLALLLHLLSQCDHIYMLKGWENNDDIRLLHDYASCNGYRIIYSKKF